MSTPQFAWGRTLWRATLLRPSEHSESTPGEARPAHYDRPAMSDLSGLPEDTFHALVEQSVAGIYILQDERFVYANAHWADIVGLTPQEMIGGHLSRFVAPEDLDALLDKYYRRLRGDPPSMHFITRGLHADGRVLQIEVHGSRMLYRGRPAVMGVGIDVTERLRNEAELLRLREQLQALTAYTAAKLEEQRQQFARDVHDVLGGMLTSIKMDATRGPSRAAAACCTRCRPTRRRCGCRPSAPSRSTARSRRR